MKNKFNSKESLLDFLKSSWENGKKMDATNFSSTWDALVKNLKFEDGYRPDVTITDGGDGTHTLTITNPDGTTTSAVIKDGKDGKDGKNGENGANGTPGAPGKDGFSPEVTLTNGNDGTHTLTISKPDGTTTSTVIKDGKQGEPGKDGFSPEVTLTNEKDGTHTLTITKPGGVTTSAVIKDGKNGENGADGKQGEPGKDGFSPEVTIVDGTDGTHTLTISKPGGTTTSTIIKDGKDGKNGANGTPGAPGKDGFSPEVTLTNGNDGTHTLTISKPDGTTTSAVIKDGKDGKNGANGENGADGAPGTPGKDGFSPEVALTNGNDGTHTLTISKPDGTTTSTVIKDGKNGKDGTPGISYTHPLDKNSMSLMSYSHTYYPLYQTENFDSSSPFSKFTPDIKVEVNSVAVDAPTGSIEPELSDGEWTKGLVPTSYVITMFSNNLPSIGGAGAPGAQVDGNFSFSGSVKGNYVANATLDIPIDSLKLPTADGTSKSIADVGFISASTSVDKQPMFFMTYPRAFLIPVSVVERNAGGSINIIQDDTAIVLIKPAINSMFDVPVISHEIYQSEIAKFAPSRKSISELQNVFKYSWTAGTVHIPFTVQLLKWNETLKWNEKTDDIDMLYTIQSDGCEKVEAYPTVLPIGFDALANTNELTKSVLLNPAGREVMKLFIGDPNSLGLINL